MVMYFWALQTIANVQQEARMSNRCTLQILPMCPEHTGLCVAQPRGSVPHLQRSSLLWSLSSEAVAPITCSLMTSEFIACITNKPSTVCLKRSSQGTGGQRSNTAVECGGGFISSVPFPGDGCRGSGKLSEQSRSNHSASVKHKTRGVRRM